MGPSPTKGDKNFTPSVGGSSLRKGSSLSAQPVRVAGSAADVEQQEQNLFDIHTSELQLEEETEKDGVNDGEVSVQTEERWRMDTIGVKGFKVLKLLRAQRQDENDMLATVSGSQKWSWKLLCCTLYLA